MLKVIFADDEPMILRGLEKLIDWEKIGVKVVGMARNGQEALDLIDEHKPDLVISDINMPKFSGIDLLKRLNEEESEVKLIFISGYQEFEYARDALKYGAIDYLIKPVNEQQLLMAVQKVIDSVGIEQQQPITLELHIGDDSTGMDFEDLIADSQQHLIDEEGHYCVFCCYMDDVEACSEDELEILQFSVKNIIEDLLAPVKGHWIISKEDRIYILLYDHDVNEVEAVMSTLPREIIETIKGTIKQSVSMSTSNIVDDINDIQLAFKLSNERIKQRYFYGPGCVYNYSRSGQSKYTLEDLYKAQVSILDSINSYDRNKIYKVVKYYMEIVKDVSLWNKQSTLNYCLATLVFIQEHLVVASNQIKKRDFNVIKEAYEKTKYYEQAIDLMSQTCETYLQEIVSHISSHQNDEIKKVKAYIQDHYSEAIKLETLADLVFMNPNYFSGYFKKHVGVKFKEYITNYRINEAEKLMLGTNYKVYEIAEAVGFGDYRHFSEVFKKIKGQNPSEYRKRIMNTYNENN